MGLKTRLCSLLVFASLIFTNALAADTSKGAQSAPVKTKRRPAQDVQILTDPDVDTSLYEEAGYNVYKPGSSGSGVKEVPPPSLRDKTFLQSGFTAGDLRGWDAVDLDMLFIRARLRSEEDLFRSYPKLHRAKLRRLKPLATNANW